MGMYATIINEEIKFTGLLATATHDCGITVEHASITISREAVPAILLAMANSMAEGRDVIKGQYRGQAVYRLRRNTKVLALLFDWAVFHEDEDELFFI